MEGLGACSVDITSYVLCSKDFEEKMKPTTASHNPNVDGKMLWDFVVSRGIIHIP